MKSSALILLVALVVASSAQARQCAHQDVHPNDKCKQAGRFHICAATIPIPGQLFNPAITLDKDYDTPDCDPTKTVAPEDLALFNKVYGLLTAGKGRQDVATKFCRKLKNIYVTAGPNAYGVWEIPGRGDGSMFIVVPPLAKQPNQPQTLADQENIMLAAALAPNPVPAGLYYESDDSATDGMALLAILAHELGHLLLADKNADGTGDAANGHVHPRTDPAKGNCDPPAAQPDQCFENQFLQAGANKTLWDRDLFHSNMRRWIDFGGRNNNHYLDPNHDLDWAIAGNYDKFLDGEYASFYAALSPEEDFVETYKYNVLADVAQRSNLRLHIPGVTDPLPVLNNVSSVANGSNLKGKIDCVKHLTP
jgi:hypothetical protein